MKKHLLLLLISFVTLHTLAQSNIKETTLLKQKKRLNLKQLKTSHPKLDKTAYLSQLPEPKEGEKRYLIYHNKLDTLKQDINRRELPMEFYVGRFGYLGCNSGSYHGKFEKKSVKDGVDYWVYNSEGMGITAIYCPGTIMRKKLITSHFEKATYEQGDIIAVYVPEKLSLKYTLLVKRKGYTYALEFDAVEE